MVHRPRYVDACVFWYALPRHIIHFHCYHDPLPLGGVRNQSVSRFADEIAAERLGYDEV